MQILKRSDSRLLERSVVEVRLDGKAGKLTRKEAIMAVAQELGVALENVGVVRLDGRAGTTDVMGKFYVYSSAEAKKSVHPSYLMERVLTKEERENLKQERKKAATARATAAEAKK